MIHSVLQKQFGELFFRRVVRSRVPNALRWVDKQERFAKQSFVLSPAPVECLDTQFA